MAVTVVDYGDETPQTVDRFGEREPLKFARRFWWTSNRYTGSRTYRMLTHNDRSIQANVDPEGNVLILLDGAIVFDEKPPRARGNRTRG